MSRNLAQCRTLYITLCTYNSEILITRFRCGFYRFIFLFTFLYLSNSCHQKQENGLILFPVQENERKGCRYRSKVRPILIRILASSLHATSSDYFSDTRLTESCSLRPYNLVVCRAPFNRFGDGTNGKTHHCTKLQRHRNEKTYSTRNKIKNSRLLYLQRLVLVWG
jgi:hypothetical protein